MAVEELISRQLDGLATFQVPPDYTLNSGSLSPLPLTLHNGLVAVTLFGFLSFFATLSLFSVLTWQIIKWSRKSKSTSQFVVLIYNLLLADIQQSVAFVLNSRWLAHNAIQVGTGYCWAQGWFVSTGDLASGAFCFLIGIHTFASVIFNRRISNTTFGCVILATWIFVYVMAGVGVALHPADIYVRAVSWCWVNSNYPDLRLWFHYFWIFTFEFGTVLIYVAMYVTLQYRIKSDYYGINSLHAQHTRKVAKLMIVYPIIYIICTLPLATLRMISMASTDNLSFGLFCLAGAMITSNGWLDVVVYSLTRRVMLFSDEPPPDSCGIETFSMPFTGPVFLRFGTRTTCEYSGESKKQGIATKWRNKKSNGDVESQKISGLISYASTSNLFEPSSSPPSSTSSPRMRSDTFSSITVKTTTTYEVKSEPIVELDDLREATTFRRDVTGRSTSDKSESEIVVTIKDDGWRKD